MPAPPNTPRPGQRTPRARLAGTAGFLRSMAVPRLEQIVARLQLGRHEASVEDRLEDTPPTVRLRVKLRRGPWGMESPNLRGVLELSLGDRDGSVRARVWLDDEVSKPDAERWLAPAKLDAATVDAVALSFLEDLVARA